MSVLEIHTLPDSILRQKAKKVNRIDNTVQKLIDDMIETLRAEPNRAGLAAPQVGVPLRIAVIELPEHGLITLVNPEVIKKEGERVVQEAAIGKDPSSDPMPGGVSDDVYQVLSQGRLTPRDHDPPGAQRS